MKQYLDKVRLTLNILRYWSRGMKFKNTGHDTNIHVMWDILKWKHKMKWMNERNHHNRNETIVDGVSMVAPNNKFDLPIAGKAGKKS